MPGLGVALLAKLRRTAREHGGVVGAVGQMTEAAILGSRRVLPQMWAALVGMTVKTGLVEVGLGQQMLSG